MGTLCKAHPYLGTAGREQGKESGSSAGHTLRSGGAACTPQLLGWQEAASAGLMLEHRQAASADKLPEDQQ